MDPIAIFKKLNKRNKILKQKFKKAKKSKISKKNTLFIFDWDDTLFPTSWMDKKENKDANLCLLDNKISELIQKIESYGSI